MNRRIINNIKYISNKRVKCYLPVCNCVNQKVDDKVYINCVKKSNQKYLNSLSNEKSIIDKYYENKVDDIFLL